jgi:hypothetical protein
MPRLVVLSGNVEENNLLLLLFSLIKKYEQRRFLYAAMENIYYDYRSHSKLDFKIPRKYYLSLGKM